MVNFCVSSDELQCFVARLESIETSEHLSRLLRFLKDHKAVPTGSEKREHEALILAERWRQMATKNLDALDNFLMTLLPELDTDMDIEASDARLQCGVCLHNQVVFAGECGHMTCHRCTLELIRASRVKCPTCNSKWLVSPLRKCYF